MPYKVGERLSGERASKLGHLEVIQSPLVNELVNQFQSPNTDIQLPKNNWEDYLLSDTNLDIVFAVDGSLQVVEDEIPPHKALAFVKTALMRVDQVALSKIDKETPHPFALRDLMSDSAMYHATVFPLRYVVLPNMSVYDAVRQTIFESLKDDSLDGEPMETLKWIAFEKWSSVQKDLPGFQCPHCGYGKATLPYDTEKGICANCSNTLYISDMLGFHLEMVEDAARDSIASAYMNIHETLMLFTGIRYYWETNRKILSRCLFIKDGPLQIRAQYSKLVAPIRRFLEFAHEEGVNINLLGQEKTGAFVDHLSLIGRTQEGNKIFIPDHKYICEQIQQRPSIGAPYGKDTNYGAKIFVTYGERYRLVLTIPVYTPMDEFIKNPQKNYVIGLDAILSALPRLLSSRFENGLFPIELANSIASLSTYPSAEILKMFAINAMK